MLYVRVMFFGELSISRIVLRVEYDGSNYHGWQSQLNDNVATVQSVLTHAVASVADHPVKLYCAGRTDTGVHATGQIVHFDTGADRQLKAWVMGVNRNLPPNVCVYWAYETSDDFHARFSATARRYCYIIENNPVRPAILSGLLTHVRQKLDVASMHKAGQSLLGELDFSSYRGSSCQSPTAMRNVMHLNVRSMGSRVLIDIKANAFLLHMVRNIVGVLLEVGYGKKDIDWPMQVLEARDRNVAGITAPPYGLYLTEVSYPDEFGLPEVTSVIPVCGTSLD